VLLKWSKPHDDGGMSITRYVIQKSNYGGVVPKDAWTDAISAAVLDCEQVDEMQFQVSVAKLVKGKTYEFRVFAENKIGLSEPSPGSDPHLCRSKNGSCLLLSKLVRRR
jgi:titin